MMDYNFNKSSKSGSQVSVDGVIYRSDQFYLLKTENSNHDDKSGNFLDLSRLLANLDLVAILASTFSLDISWMKRDLPTFFTTPSLILIDSKKSPMQQKKDPSSTDSTLKRKQVPNNNTKIGKKNSFLLQRHTKRRMKQPVFASETNKSSNNTTHTLNSSFVADNNVESVHRMYPSSKMNELPSHLHLSKVAPSYIHTQKKMRKRVLGVQHAKYMILLERSGSIVVYISTANLTRPLSTDACWIQRFHLIQQGTNNRNQFSKIKPTIRNDFGEILCNFLQNQSNSIVTNHDDETNNVKKSMTPLQFLKTYTNSNITSLRQWTESYDFQTAQVFLVSTIPGKFPIHSTVKDIKQTRFQYGAQRVSQIMRYVHKKWLPSSSHRTHATKLIFQPTSLGGKWSRDNLLDMIKSYLEPSNIDDEDDESLFQRVHILWPTMKFMQSVKHKYDLENKAFLSSKSFNDMNLEVISRMAIYKPNLQVISSSNKSQPLSPHIKSYARFLTPENNKHLAWFLLTSACFSRGAQGKFDTETSTLETKLMSYSNFELGVLFISRLEGNKDTDRLYTTGSVENINTNHNIIPLPIPYSVDNIVPYHCHHENNEDVDFIATPYFHEIVTGTGTMGQMALTPLGKKLLAKQEKK